MSVPRGVRLNNPCSIRKSNMDWLGKVPTLDDAFEQFDTPEDGIRAAAKILINYKRLYGLSTIAEIINRWAPPNENPTAAYTNFVCQSLEANPDDAWDVLDPTQLSLLVAAIIREECGCSPYPAGVIAAGVKAALA